MSESAFAILIETALPRDCWVVAIRNVYFDESGTHQDARYLTIAGYIFEPQQAARFSRDWSKVLDKYGLPYAHMTDAVCGNGVYAHLTDPECDKVNRLLIENIKRRALVGFAYTIDRHHYDAEVGSLPGFPTSYAFCASAALKGVGEWAERVGFDGRFSYVFEAGHQHQVDLDGITAHMASLGETHIDRYRYSSHTFMRKGDAPPLHAADMLAWQIAKHIKDKRNSPEQFRADFKALLRPQDWRVDYTKNSVDEFKERWSAVVGKPDSTPDLV